MGNTSSDVKMRYNSKAYKKVGVTFRKDTDADLIKFVETHKGKIGTTQLFREALEHYIKNEKSEE